MIRPDSEQTEKQGLLIRLECNMSRRGSTFLAACEKLGIFDQGKTEEEARHNLQISLTLFFKELSGHATVEQLLTDRGVQFTPISAEHQLPEIMDGPQVVTEVDVSVPYSAALARGDEIRKIPVAAYLWAHQGQRFGTVRS